MTQRTIAIFTTTRAEFGLFLPLLQAINADPDLRYLLFVGGTHLAVEHGYTLTEIQEQKYPVTDTFDYLLNENTSFSLSRSMGVASIELAHLFQHYSFDAICILGDRYELLPIVTTAILFKKPIFHINGGEKTEGVIDEQIRHMVTKASHLHFVACEEYAQNVRRMGEPANRIIITGALGIDNIVNLKKIPKSDLYENLGLNPDQQTVLLTYHPVTLEFEVPPEKQISNLFEALSHFKFQVVVTAPNIEVNRDKLLRLIKENVAKNDHYHYFDSLGVLRYHSLIPHCLFVIGNSSSGILEVPFFRIPTVNIGDRQQGRLRHLSIIDTDYSVPSIMSGIHKAQDVEFRKSLTKMTFKFGNGQAAPKIVNSIKSIDINQQFIRKVLDFPEN
ncbi:MAG: UDP-N-acetylglucosamine 2-epimerase (hydrolyzing) [Gemmatimonadetes bacterium]|nr:MAG: UDP-N-acetylglucosamine 2-epimerase (hydrolyzing) [Gemmatimonadota bacterium]